jgi:hypothetical protein
LNIISWLNRCFQVHSSSGDEYLLSCPACGKPKLYFNKVKKVGFCQHDKCKYHSSPPKLRDLVEEVGFVPEDLDFDLEVDDTYGATVEETLVLPGQQLVTQDAGKYYTRYPKAMEAVQRRGVKPSYQYRFNFHFDGSRIYIPVYYRGVLVSYVGRAAWWFENDFLRYRYPKHSKIHEHLFNYEAASMWPRLTLFENTFNAIRWMDELQSTSTFGSHLSVEQMDKIAYSQAATVAILWDRNAEKGAEKAVQRLADRGVRVAFLWMDAEWDQPDEIPDHWLQVIAERVHETAREGNQWIRMTSLMKTS